MLGQTFYPIVVDFKDGYGAIADKLNEIAAQKQ